MCFVGLCLQIHGIKQRLDQLEAPKTVAPSGSARIIVALSTMRRPPPVAQQYLWRTVDSILPHLGVSEGLEVALLIVNVEESDEFSKEIRERYKGHPIAVQHKHSQPQNPCEFAHLYNDTFERVLWRTKRSMDMLTTLRLAAAQKGDFILVLEDDTAVLGEMRAAIQQCVELSAVICRWDFYMKRPDAERRLGWKRLTRQVIPPVNLQGVFGLMMPTNDWNTFVEWATPHVDKAPADWLLGRWLFLNDWKMALMQPKMNLHHMATVSTRSKRETRTWESECPQKVLGRYSLHWVGSENLYVEIPYVDMDGYDVGVDPQARLMDQGGHLIKCDQNPRCVAVNRNGWMKKELVASVLSPAAGKKALFIKTNATTDWAALDAFYDACIKHTPITMLRRKR